MEEKKENMELTVGTVLEGKIKTITNSPKFITLFQQNCRRRIIRKQIIKKSIKNTASMIGYCINFVMCYNDSAYTDKNPRT